LIIRDHVEALTVLFRPQGFHAAFWSANFDVSQRCDRSSFSVGP
jgi:hypothetical protein